MENYIRRDSYLEQLINRRENGLIKVITGIRRCGKSFLLFDLFYDYLLGEGVPTDHIITIALDDDLNVAYREPAKLSEYIRSKVTGQEGMFYIFIDEVQYAISREELKNPEDIRLYNVLNGLQRLRNVDIYVTGSNSKMLSKDVMTAFRGRGDSVEVVFSVPSGQAVRCEGKKIFFLSVEILLQRYRASEYPSEPAATGRDAYHGEYHVQ